VAKLKLAEAIFKGEYHKIVDALGGIAHHLADQYELQRLGHPFYNSRAGGGEGHLEVAKNIYYSNKDLAHMVLS
jgi:predicted nucleotide-binding protein (sugar kinase/HSP70/actin superfamily)